MIRTEIVKNCTRAKAHATSHSDGAIGAGANAAFFGAERVRMSPPEEPPRPARTPSARKPRHDPDPGARQRDVRREPAFTMIAGGPLGPPRASFPGSVRRRPAHRALGIDL
jgi:hypothetical protein